MTSYLTQKGILSWIVTTDHKRIGIMYLATTLLFFLVGGIFALLVRLELFSPGRTIVGAHTYNVFFTLHGAIMIFLFIIPIIPSALGNFLVPLMIGARDVAFPRLNLASYWIFVLASLVVIMSLASPPDTGWTFYTPYSAKTGTGVSTIALGAFLVGVSSILTGLNFIVTIHSLRAKGMTWKRLPLFIWAAYATSLVQVLATPVLGVTLLLLIAERIFGVGFFDPSKGGDPLLFQHFFWIYSHPAVYIMILPAMGIVSEVIPVFSRKPIFGYTAIALSSMAIAGIGFLVWGHHLFTSGMSDTARWIFSLLSFLVAVPSGIKVFNWVATMYRGAIDLKSPMLYAVSFIFLFTIGGLTGLFVATLAADVHLHDTYFVVAHFHYTMMGGTVMGLFAGLHYWFPKMFGRMYNERMARYAWLGIFLGFNITFFNMFILGARGMPRRYFEYLPRFHEQHVISTVGSWILTLGLLILFVNILWGLLRGDKAPPNPWNALSLEWQTSSPPPQDNFEELPEVTDWPYGYGKKAEGLG